jgi:hypothetical protein
MPHGEHRNGKYFSDCTVLNVQDSRTVQYCTLFSDTNPFNKNLDPDSAEARRDRQNFDHVVCRRT